MLPYNDITVTGDYFHDSLLFQIHEDTDNQYNFDTTDITKWSKLLNNGHWYTRDFDKIIIFFLEQAVQGNVSKILLSVPPRHGKSTLISKNFASYFLVNNPNDKVILSSYSQSLASEFGKSVKDIINAYADQTMYKPKVSSDSKAKNKFHIAPPYEGQMLSVGANGSILGFGAGLFIVDDPLKNVKEAESRTIQRRLYDWFMGTAKTRLERRYNGLPPIMIVIAQRLHLDDLHGIIRQNEPVINAKEAITILKNGEPIPEDTWVDLNFPAICMDPENDILGRSEGEVLWEEQRNYDWLMSERKSMGSYLFNSIYQGEPQEREGTIFKRHWFYDPKTEKPTCIIPHKNIPEDLPMLRYWDLAASGDEGDELAGALTAWDGETMYLLDMINGNYTPSQVSNTVVKTCKKDGRYVPVLIEQEGGSQTKVLIDDYQHHPDLRRYKIRPDKVAGKGNKSIRAFKLEVLVETGCFRISDRIPYSLRDKILKQLISFTGEDGGTDDIVDSLSGSARSWTHQKTRVRIA